MSLAATGGGVGGVSGGVGGASGVALAHSANSVQVPNAQQFSSAGASGTTASGMPGAPVNVAGLGADLVDKQQSLSAKQMKAIAHLPLVAVDLHASEPLVSMYPPKPQDITQFQMPLLMGKMKADLFLNPTETAHKTLRKFLTNSKTYTQFMTDCLSKASDKSAVVLSRPHRWLGFRKLEHAPAFYRDGICCGESAEDSSQSNATGVTFLNSTLDGMSSPSDDDEDRVVCKVRLHSSKKPTVVLPEEATQWLLHQAQYHVALKFHQSAQLTDEAADELVDYPLAIALPAWNFHDAAIEALLDATAGVGVFFPRSLCALAGALIPRAPSTPSNKNGDLEATPLVQRLDQVLAHLRKAFAPKKVRDPDLEFEDVLVVVLFGMTNEGIECTAVEISSYTGKKSLLPFEDFNVLSNVSYQDSDPLARLEQCAADLENALERVATDSDGPSAIILYGGTSQQEKLAQKWQEILKSKQRNETEWGKVPAFLTKPDVVSNGAALLGANSHGRLGRFQTITPSKGGSKQIKPELAMRLQYVAPVAVGIQSNYHGGQANKWTPTKTIFDFDRRVPAGPFTLDLSAAECALYMKAKSHAEVVDLDHEELVKAIEKWQGAKNIPIREEAALNFSIQVYERWTRDGEWIKVGDPLEPLVKLASNDDSKGGSNDEDEEDKVKRVACEDVELQISLGPTGMISTNLVGPRESVVQAVQTAKWDYVYRILLIAFCVLFFGGFLARSYWEEYVLERDTKRLLAYYKHVIPGSISDGDERGAKFIAYRFRHKKDKLWKKLEKKYGVPVLHAHEWEDYDATADQETSRSQEETVDDLDDEEDEGEL